MAFSPLFVFRTLRRMASAAAFAVLLRAFRRRRHALPLLLVAAACATPLTAQTFDSRVIVISVDGLRPDIIEDFSAEQLPTFRRLMDEAAFTLNARSDPQFTLTMPNHASMMTGRWVHGEQSHGWAYNADTDGPETIHLNANAYIPSMWDVAHDEGARTALFATKEKFITYDRSWDDTHGQADAVLPDYGRDKIDRFVVRLQSEDMVSAFMIEASASPFDLAFLHIADPDREGHATGWNPVIGSAYSAAVSNADAQIARVLAFVESDPGYIGQTHVIVTADHGGTALNHSNPDIEEHYRVPFFVWGPSAIPRADLYDLNAEVRTDPGALHVEQTVDEYDRPIQNADAANLALKLMGLSPIPGSAVGGTNPLVVRQVEESSSGGQIDPSLMSDSAFQNGVSPSVEYAGTLDTKLRSDAPSTPFGDTPDLEVDSGPDYAALIRWDLSSLPSNAVVTDAALVLNVTNVSTATYYLHAMETAWDDATATWNDRSTGEPWTSPGVERGSDRGTDILGIVEGPDLGTLRVELNEEGLAVVERWIADPATNFGFILANYDANEDGLDLSSSEAADATLRPRLEVAYELPVPPGPTPPEAQFELTNERGIGTNQVLVDGTLTIHPDTSIVSWEWDFGDQGSAIGPTAAHSYQSAGTYEVALTVVDANGLTSTQSKIVIVDAGETGEGAFQQAVSPLNSYSGATDVRLQSDEATVNFGEDVSLLVDGSPDYATLMRWDLSAVAPGVEVTSAFLNVYVTNTSIDEYSLYPVRASWDENVASWNQAMTGVPWAQAGAADVQDRLGEAIGTLAAPDSGWVRVELNDVGRAWVANWINNPATNHGLVIQNFDSAEDGIDFLSSEAPVAEFRPRLELAWQMAHHVNLPERVEFGSWPNPFRDQVNVRIDSDLRHPVELTIHDMLGRRVLRQTIDPLDFGGVRLDTSFLAAGVYALTLTEHGTRVSSTRMIARQ